MYYKCDLLIGGYSYPVTDYIMNWDDMTVSFKRGDYDGIVRTFTDKFEFVKGARTLLLREYRTNYLKAGANIVISTRNNSWTWTERFRCALDFSTLSDNGYVVSINAVDDSVAALIKAKKGTEYEYSVLEMAESEKLHYDGMGMQNNIVMNMPPNNTDNDTIDIVMEENGYYTVPLYIENSEIIRRNEIELTDQMENFYIEADWIDEMPYFFKNTSDRTIIVRIRMKFDVFYNSKGSVRTDTFYLRGAAKGQLPLLYYSYTFPTPAYTFDIDVDVHAAIPPSYTLQAYFFSQYGESAVRVSNISVKPTITWMSRRDAVRLDVVKPATLLNKLLKSMNGGKEGLNGVIVASGEKRLDNAMLLAAESARQMPNAKVYSSFDKFSKWMSSVFGYVYDINGKTVTFRPRKDYFGGEVVKTITDFTGYKMNVQSSLIYSQVNIGYEKQDYDSVNGKDEFRFTNIYNTGLTLTDNKLELISPYRADAYGIEFLAQKIGEDTTDNSSDTDLFFVCAASDGTQYILDRSDLVEGVISPATMFNAAYSPTSMIEANKAFLGGFISELGYASSEGNTAVTINGNAENRDITIDGGLFLAEELEVETSDIELPEDMTGIVEFEYQGNTIQGYYKGTDFAYAKTKSAKITLIRKK